MRHILISVISIIAVFAYCLFTDIYISDFGDAVNRELMLLGEEKSKQTEITDRIENILDTKETIVNFIVNKEQYENIYNCFIQMKTAIEFENAQDIEMYKKLFQLAVNDMVVQNKNVI